MATQTADERCEAAEDAIASLDPFEGDPSISDVIGTLTSVVHGGEKLRASRRLGTESKRPWRTSARLRTHRPSRCFTNTGRPALRRRAGSVIANSRQRWMSIRTLRRTGLEAPISGMRSCRCLGPRSGPQDTRRQAKTSTPPSPRTSGFSQQPNTPESPESSYGTEGQRFESSWARRSTGLLPWLADT